MDNSEKMENAKKLGYKGDSNTEASAWVNAAEKGLDLSDEARFERAREMGFNTDDIYYHGTKHQFDRFDKSTIGKNYNYAEDSGFFFTKKKSTAESHSMDHKTLTVNRVIPVFLKFKNPYVTSTDSDYWQPSDRFDISGHDMMSDVKFEKKDAILIKGTRNDDICVVLDPSQILSIHAAFDLETEYYKPELDLEEISSDFIFRDDYTSDDGLAKLNTMVSDFYDYCKQENINIEEAMLKINKKIPPFFTTEEADKFKNVVSDSLDKHYNDDNNVIKQKRRRTCRN